MNVLEVAHLAINNKLGRVRDEHIGHRNELAVWAIKEWRAQSRRLKVKRVTRNGHTVTICEPDHSAHRAKVEAVLRDRWLVRALPAKREYDVAFNAGRQQLRGKVQKQSGKQAARFVITNRPNGVSLEWVFVFLAKHGPSMCQSQKIIVRVPAALWGVKHRNQLDRFRINGELTGFGYDDFLIDLTNQD
jgi:hypothetical protein